MKGFTLIELIAVILILGILAFIAIPQVNNAIDSSKKNSAIVSASRYVEAIENDIANRKMKRQDMIEDGVKTLDDLESIEVDGEVPTSATLTIKDSEVIYSEIVVRDYTVTCTKENGCTAIKGYYIFFSDLTVGFQSLPNNINDYKDRPENKYAYLKYPVIEGKLKTPQACLYKDGIEFCLNTKERSKTIERIKKYFEYDDSWISDSENVNKKYKPGTNKNTYCIIPSNNSTIDCRNQYVGASDINYILVSDFPKIFGCAINDDGAGGCSTMEEDE